MAGKSIEKNVIAFVRKHGGRYRTNRGDVIGDIRRRSPVANTTRRAVEDAVSCCIKNGSLEPIMKNKRMIGLQEPAS